MDKDIAYYKHVAETFYLNHFAEIKEQKDKENASYKDEDEEFDYEEDYLKRIIVNTQDETCLFPQQTKTALRPQELLFLCKMDNDKAEAYFMEDGKDKVVEMLGLVDLYCKTERIEIDFVRKEDGELHLNMPENLQEYGKSYFKVKLYGLDDFVSECNYAGWGDNYTNNVLEVLGGIMSQDFIDFEKNEIIWCLNWLLGPSESEDMNYYAQFDFSHLEIAKDDDCDSNWVIFICYNYSGIHEYEQE